MTAGVTRSWEPANPLRDFMRGFLRFYIQKDKPYYLNPSFTLYMTGSILGIALSMGVINQRAQNDYTVYPLTVIEIAEKGAERVLGSALLWGVCNTVIWGGSTLNQMRHRRKALVKRSEKSPHL